jgi:hypothetical protein
MRFFLEKFDLLKRNTASRLSQRDLEQQKRVVICTEDMLAASLSDGVLPCTAYGIDENMANYTTPNRWREAGASR